MNSRGFTMGVCAGVLMACCALFFTQPSPATFRAAGHWIELNLGLSIWFFSAVAAVFVVQLIRLQNIMRQPPKQISGQLVSRMDQMTDIWAQVFIGIGVIWTAIGMRSALQSALGDPDNALTDTAGNVLKDLVDGGILLALSTTIVGAVGGYLMRLLKTATVGAQLHAFYASREQQDVAALLQATQRIEAQLRGHPSAPELQDKPA